MKPLHRIAVLFHEDDRYRATHGHILYYLADLWREWGFSVTYLYGVRRFEPADLLFVHVDLSVVPDEYLEFASKYPATVNLGVTDIRKSRISTNIIDKEDSWQGPVIVKSDLNYGGMPELARSRSYFAARWPVVRKLRSRIDRLLGAASPAESAIVYEVYDDLSLVPPSRVSDQRLVIEKFLPEIENDLYYVRIYQFLGDRWTCLRISSRDPIVKSQNTVSVEMVEPHPGVVEWRKRLSMDYGKLDYVIVDGKPVLLDANKTIGASPAGMAQLLSDEQVLANRHLLAKGIYSFF